MKETALMWIVGYCIPKIWPILHRCISLGYFIKHKDLISEEWLIDFFLANHPASVRPKRKSKMSSSNLMNCFVCKKNFKSIKELQTHQRANHRKFSETSKGFFICQRCGEHYFTQVNMKSSNSIKMAIEIRGLYFY